MTRTQVKKVKKLFYLMGYDNVKEELKNDKFNLMTDVRYHTRINVTEQVEQEIIEIINNLK